MTSGGVLFSIWLLLPGQEIVDGLYRHQDTMIRSDRSQFSLADQRPGQGSADANYLACVLNG
jgi:hypothetical protein